MMLYDSCHYFHFGNEQTELNYLPLRSQSQCVTEPGLEPRLF